MTTCVDNRYGEVMVIQVVAPRTSHRVRGNATLDADVDLSYWSSRKGGSVADGAVASSLIDEPAPQDANGRYTIVASTEAARPLNAPTEGGVARMAWGWETASTTRAAATRSTPI